jgi:multiple sugar transport system permease protein
MSTSTEATAVEEAATESAPSGRRPKRKRFTLLTRRDKGMFILLLGLPFIVHIFFVWVPALLSILLSFTRWDGIGGIETIEWIGLRNYEQIATIYPPFWPAVTHNLIWLGFFILIATPFGMYLAVQLDKELKGSKFYQNVFFVPVVLSLALVGFIWQLIYAPEEGLINNVLGRTDPENLIDWLGNPSINLWMILIAASWRHVGYIMILYLAGLKSVDPALKEAAAIDGATSRQTFFHVVFPVLKPINIVILVITIIESLRAFDIVYVTNKGTNGLELLSVAVTNNIIGEASRIGFGSALAVILLLVSLAIIIPYLWRTFRSEAMRV